MHAPPDRQAPVSKAINREIDVYLAMGVVRQIASGLGCNDIDRTKLEIIVLELARNILNHAQGQGSITFSIEPRNTKPGILVTALDHGPGIADIEQAMQDGYSTAGTLGAGLPGVKRLADLFDIQSELGQGTTVHAWKALSNGRNKGR